MTLDILPGKRDSSGRRLMKIGRWSTDQYRAALEHPIAQAGFKSDFDAMQWADVCVLVLPCGRSAHSEAGWMKGAGKK